MANNVLSVEPPELCKKSAAELVALISAKAVSSREVVQSHVEHIARVNPKLNAIVVPLYDEAIDAAAECDRQQSSGQSLGPLHGLPITIKEMFDVEGLPTTAGITTLSNHKASADAPVVEALRSAGAVILGKTNVPMMGLKATSDNPLYGSTKNPWNLDRSPGGSSGGEAAIIAACGSPLGLGSDGGGSIRQPSHSVGICGIKPTGMRFPMVGHWSMPCWTSEWAQPGPMARSVDDLTLGLNVLINAPQSETMEGNGRPIAGVRTVDVRSLRVGHYSHLVG